MWPKRCSLATSVLWQVDAGLGDRRGLQLRVLRLRAVDGMARDARQVARVVHAALPLRVRRPVVAGRRRLPTTSRGFIVVKTRIFVLSPLSACSLPGPWQRLARLVRCWPTASARSAPCRAASCSAACLRCRGTRRTCRRRRSRRPARAARVSPAAPAARALNAGSAAQQKRTAPGAASWSDRLVHGQCQLTRSRGRSRSPGRSSRRPSTCARRRDSGNSPAKSM